MRHDDYQRIVYTHPGERDTGVGVQALSHTSAPAYLAQVEAPAASHALLGQRVQSEGMRLADPLTMPTARSNHAERALRVVRIHHAPRVEDKRAGQQRSPPTAMSIVALGYSAEEQHESDE